MKKFSMVILVFSFFAILAGMNSALWSNEVEAEAFNSRTDESGQWAHQYKGPESDFASAIVQTEDGGFVMAGHTDSFGTGNLDLWVIKLDANGFILWEKTYGDDNLEYASDITEAENGDLLVAGSMFVYGGQGTDWGYWILRLSGTGEIIWQKRFTEAFSDENDLLETSDQGMVIAGGWNVGTSIMKLDFDGNVLWQKLYDDQVVLFSGDYFSIDERSDGGFIASFSKSEGGQWLARLDLDGNIVWQKLLSGYYYRVTVNTSEDDNFYVSGHANFAPVILKFSPNGDMLWQKSLSQSGKDYNFSLWNADATNDGGLILAARLSQNFTGDKSYWLIRLDTDGNLVWNQTYAQGKVADVAQTLDSEYIVVGNQNPGNPAPYYPWALTDENSMTRPEAFPTPDASFDVLAFKVDTYGDINGCSEIQPGNAIITDTNVTLVDAFVTPIAITPNPTDSLITPQTSNATEEVVCFFSPTSTPTPTGSSTPTNTPTITLTPTPSPTTTSTPTPTETNTPAPDNQIYLPIIHLP